MGPSSTSSQLSGAVIAVMGAGSGIGKEVVAELMNVGTRLSLADLRKEAVEEQAQAICASGGNCIAFEVDIRDTQAVDKWIEETVKVFGRLDGAVNSAGARLRDLFNNLCVLFTDLNTDLPKKSGGCRSYSDQIG